MPLLSGVAGAQQESEPEILYWVAPMDPNYRREEPGKSPMGMDLVPVYADQAGGDSVSIDPANLRLHDDENIAAIKGSLARFGQRKPIVVNREGNVIEAGNGTWAAAKSLGWPKIAAVFVEEGDPGVAELSQLDGPIRAFPADRGFQDQPPLRVEAKAVEVVVVQRAAGGVEGPAAP